MKKIILSIAALLLTSNLQAAEFGFGATLYSDSSIVYLPINVTKEFRVEPYFSSYRQSSDDSSYRYTQYGVGLFNIRETADNVNAIVGARVGHVSSKSGSSFDGYTFSPVLGFEYLPIKKLSLGADVAWMFTKGKYEYPGYDENYDTKESRTTTSISLKYYFD